MGINAGATTVAPAQGFLGGGAVGASLACLVVGLIVENGALIGTGLGVPAVCGLFLLIAGARRRSREGAIAPRVALAMIESRDVTESEEPSSDVSVRFDLTVAPDDAPAYRVEVTQDVHVADLGDYRPGGVLVVRYPPDEPWRVRIVKRPTPQWEQRAIDARLVSAAGPVLASEPEERGSCLVTLLGLLLGAAVVVLLFRTDLMAHNASPPPPSPQTHDVPDQSTVEFARASAPAAQFGTTASETDAGGHVVRSTPAR